MFYFQNNLVVQNSTVINLKKLGEVRLDQMMILPFVAPYYKGNMIKRFDQDMCKEFDGDCFMFFLKYIDLKWIDSYD